MKKVHLCGMCNTLYLNGRPFVCDNCNSNVAIEEVETTDEEIEKCRGIEGIKIVEEVREIKGIDWYYFNRLLNLKTKGVKKWK